MRSVGIATLSPTTPAHGTAMAQAILQGIQQQSTTSRARIISVNVFGSDETASTWNVALGVQAAVEGGATVLNMSLAGGTDSAVLEDIIKQALAKNVVIFAAAGNEPVDTPNYPAAISGVNAVTALSSPGQLASYANFGSFVEMALPGTAYVNLGGQAWVVQGTSPRRAQRDTRGPVRRDLPRVHGGRALRERLHRMEEGNGGPFEMVSHRSPGPGEPMQAWGDGGGAVEEAVATGRAVLFNDSSSDRRLPAASGAPLPLDLRAPGPCRKA